MPLRKPRKNFLDMIPVWNIKDFTQDGEKITLIIPKFKREWMRKWLIPAKRSKHIKVHLDDIGSKVWLLIDGKRKTGEICSLLGDSLPDSVWPDHTAELRVIEFLRQLYRNRFILFRS
jgi:hypothetical protein